MSNNFSAHIEELKLKKRQIILVTGVKLKSKELLKTLDKLETECPNIDIPRREKEVWRCCEVNFCNRGNSCNKL